MNQLYRVIVAEDEELQLNSLVRKIERLCPDFSVVDTAQTGKTALKKIREHNPDLLITDIRMPLLSGIELLEAVRKEFPSMECIIISGFSDFQYAQTAIRLGASDYLLKPLDNQELVNAIEKVRGLLLLNNSKAKEEHSVTDAAISSRKMIEELHQLIQENYTTDINLNDFAQDRNYSASHLSKFYLQQYGISPIKEILALRIKKARQLLSDSPELSVREIGELIGYPDQAYFSRIFKKQTGVSPAQFRDQQASS